MTKKELREYLGIVVDMEKNIFLQKDLINHFDRELAKLKIPETFVEPDQPIYKAQEQPNLILSAIYIILGCVGLFFVAGIAAILIENFLAALFNNDFEQYDWLMISALIVPIVWALIKIRNIKAKFEQKRLADDEYMQKLYQYQQEMADIEAKQQQDAEQRSIKTALIQKERVEAEIMLDASTQRLQKIYDKNIIFPKYRNLVMTCSIYEYICAGRCDNLEGHEGAYNILELEIRLDRIITELNRIVDHLSAIQKNQYTLYSAIQDSNRRSAQLLDSSERMASSLEGFHGEVVELNKRIASMQKASELTAYCSERTQKELAYMNRMNYLSGRNDNVFWNVPPT